MAGTRIREGLAGLVAATAVVAAAPALAGAVAGTVTTSRFGIDQVAVGQADRLTVAAWAGGRGLASVLAAEHRLGTAAWTRPVVVGTGSGDVLELDLATNPQGDAVAVWGTPGPTQGKARLQAARRRRDGTWSRPSVLSEFGYVSLNFPRLPVQTADVEIAPDGRALVVYEWDDGTVLSRSLAPGREVWDAPQIIRAAPPSGLPEISDVALALSPDGRAVALWQQGSGPLGNRSLGVAERTGGGWSGPATLPGSEGGYYPAVARAGNGETIAAWTAPSLFNWVATRGPAGVWSAPSRVGTGFAPRLHVDARTIAISWPSGPDVAVRAAGATTWQVTRARVTPQAATVARDGSVVVAGVTPGGVVAWSRLRRGEVRWSALRIESNTRDVSNAQVAGIAPASTGPLATVLWRASVRPGRLGMPTGGSALQYAELSPTSGTRAGATPRLSLPPAPITTPANAVVWLYPTFQRYTGPTRVRVQIRYGSAPWRPLATLTAENEQALLVRLTRPGTGRLRMAYGPGFRLTTNSVRVRVLRTRLQRIVAGWSPKAVSAVGRDLWVLSGTRARRSELRLVDARTGRLRRGPVRIKVDPYQLELVNTGARVLLQTSSGTLRVLDSGSPRLVGATAVLKDGSCTAAGCTPMILTVGASSEYPSRSVGYVLAPVTGPDRRVWGTVADTGTTYGVAASRLVEGRETGPPVDHGRIGPLFEGHSTGTLVAVDGGVWVRDALSRVSWFGATGAGVGKGTFAVLAGRGHCVSGISERRGNSRVVRLGEGGSPNGRGVSLGQTYLQDPVDAGNTPPPLTVGSGTAWVVAFIEQTLVRVPVPGC